MSRDARLVPRFAGGPYGPGDTVEGVLVAREPIERVRSLSGHLRYIDRSPSFAGATTHVSAAPLHEGPIGVGHEIPFALRLPDDAYPNWEEPSTAEIGTLSWALVIEADIAAALDTIATHAIPIATDGRPWTGPAPSEEQRIKRYVERWDVEVTPDRWALRRGEEVIGPSSRSVSSVRRPTTSRPRSPAATTPTTGARPTTGICSRSGRPSIPPFPSRASRSGCPRMLRSPIAVPRSASPGRRSPARSAAGFRATPAASRCSRFCRSDIVSGECPGQQTLIDDPITRPCAIPADRVMGSVAKSLHHPYQLPPG